MAKPQLKSPRKKRKTTVSCFTTCFKLSDEAPSDNNRRRWLCWSRVPNLKKPAATKTVPVDGSPAASTVVESKKAAARPRNDQEKLRLIGSKSRGQGVAPPRNRVLTTAEEALEGGGEGQTLETLTEEAADHRNLAALETHVDPTEQSPYHTCPPGRDIPTDRKIEAARAAAVGSSVPIKTGDVAGKKLEPVVGMSVIMVTLVIMILWGRVCAILCTSSWLYFVPKFRSTEGSGDQGSNSDLIGLDMESSEYKKKVVLEGLLDRNRRS